MADLGENASGDIMPVRNERNAVKQYAGTDNRPGRNEGGGHYGISQPAACAVGRWSAL
jgi:hypothetical protein